MLRTLLFICEKPQLCRILRCSYSSPASNQTVREKKPTHFRYKSYDVPYVFELDDLKIKPDENWNIAPGILQLLPRQLLNEPGHPLNLLKQRIINYFNTAHRKPNSGSPRFVVCDKEPRLVTTFDNFDSLLTPADHVSRRPSDTYYVNNGYCLRAHTTAHQYKLLTQGLDSFIMYGDVYRRDEIDRTHFPCFHQLDCVRTYSSIELFGSYQYEKDEPAMFETNPTADLRTPAKQEYHTIDTARVLVIELQSSLEGLTRAIFGSEVQMRWVDAYFPFTHPSFELEVFFEGEWLEVLGCGVMDQKLLQSAGAGSKVGWAFGLGLERLAMKMYDIPDIRLFWSRDSGFLKQFANLTPDDTIKYKPISNQPQLANDLSFWLPENMDSNEMRSNTMDVIRTLGGELVEQVELVDEFFHPKKNRRSHCYRVVYRSMERSLTKEEVNVIHKSIEKYLAERFGAEIR
ncbi:tRNA synthetases class II core domain (F) domain-containing protein [Ditylenchus destructor]|nr:tRNA synthetases class II core domain (F) domain-containing protein [Ditylenchus destructor]